MEEQIFKKLVPRVTNEFSSIVYSMHLGNQAIHPSVKDPKSNILILTLTVEISTLFKQINHNIFANAAPIQLEPHTFLATLEYPKSPFISTFFLHTQTHTNSISLMPHEMFSLATQHAFKEKTDLEFALLHQSDLRSRGKALDSVKLLVFHPGITATTLAADMYFALHIIRPVDQTKHAVHLLNPIYRSGGDMTVASLIKEGNLALDVGTGATQSHLNFYLYFLDIQQNSAVTRTVDRALDRAQSESNHARIQQHRNEPPINASVLRVLNPLADAFVQITNTQDSLILQSPPTHFIQHLTVVSHVLKGLQGRGGTTPTTRELTTIIDRALPLEEDPVKKQHLSIMHQSLLHFSKDFLITTATKPHADPVPIFLHALIQSTTKHLLTWIRKVGFPPLLHTPTPTHPPRNPSPSPVDHPPRRLSPASPRAPRNTPHSATPRTSSTRLRRSTHAGSTPSASAWLPARPTRTTKAWHRRSDTYKPSLLETIYSLAHSALNTLLLRSGDVERNPGPQPTHPSQHSPEDYNLTVATWNIRNLFTSDDAATKLWSYHNLDESYPGAHDLAPFDTRIIDTLISISPGNPG
jgi:hypothetical protein